ncbi:hypothetical protein Tco_1192212 [Tanacetum coccineum]
MESKSSARALKFLWFLKSKQNLFPLALSSFLFVMENGIDALRNWSNNMNNIGSGFGLRVLNLITRVISFSIEINCFDYLHEDSEREENQDVESDLRPSKVDNAE